MKDFTTAQKLLMAVALFTAVAVALAMAVPANESDAPPQTQTGGLLTPF